MPFSRHKPPAGLTSRPDGREGQKTYLLGETPNVRWNFAQNALALS